MIGKSEGATCLRVRDFIMLVALHVQIQTAAAYEKMGKSEEARAGLKRRFQMPKGRAGDAVCGKLIYLEPLFEGTMPEVEKDS